MAFPIGYEPGLTYWTVLSWGRGRNGAAERTSCCCWQWMVAVMTTPVPDVRLMVSWLYTPLMTTHFCRVTRRQSTSMGRRAVRGTSRLHQDKTSNSTCSISHCRLATERCGAMVSTTSTTDLSDWSIVTCTRRWESRHALVQATRRSVRRTRVKLLSTRLTPTPSLSRCHHMLSKTRARTSSSNSKVL